MAGGEEEEEEEERGFVQDIVTKPYPGRTTAGGLDSQR